LSFFCLFLFLLYIINIYFSLVLFLIFALLISINTRIDAMQMTIDVVWLYWLYIAFVPSCARGSEEKNRLRLACGTCGQQYVRPLYFMAATEPTVVARTSESYVFDYRQWGLQCFPRYLRRDESPWTIVGKHHLLPFFSNFASLWLRSFFVNK